MIGAPKIVAVDNDVEHLEVLVKGFESLGGHCVALEYPGLLTRPQVFNTGVRLVFMDIDLLPGAGGAVGARTFAPVAQAVRRILATRNGPYALVTWTNVPERHDGLIAYLHANLDHGMRPGASYCLAKEVYLDDPVALLAKLNSLHLEIPGFGLLMEWERAVSNAADRAVFEVQELARNGDQGPANGLATVAFNIGAAAAGSALAKQRPFRSFAIGMSAVLADRLEHEEPYLQEEDQWADALKGHQGRLADLGAKSRLNSFFNVARLEEQARAVPGVVFHMPVADMLPYISPRFRTARGALTSGEFLPIKQGRNKDENIKNIVKKCEWRFIQIGADCDFANEKERVIEGHLAIEVPESCFGATNLQNSNQFRDTPANCDWLFQTPPFFLGRQTRVLVANLRFRVSYPTSKASEWKARYRLREELSSEIAKHSANFNTRPGIAEFR